MVSYMITGTLLFLVFLSTNEPPVERGDSGHRVAPREDPSLVASSTPEVLEIPEDTEVPDVFKIPDVPEAPEVPEVPEASGAPEAREAKAGGELDPGVAVLISLAGWLLPTVAGIGLVAVDQYSTLGPGWTLITLGVLFGGGLGQFYAGEILRALLFSAGHMLLAGTTAMIYARLAADTVWTRHNDYFVAAGITAVLSVLLSIAQIVDGYFAVGRANASGPAVGTNGDSSPMVAFSLALLTTTVPVVAGWLSWAMAYEYTHTQKVGRSYYSTRENGTAKVFAVVSVLAGVVLGPSAGHYYVGEWLHALLATGIRTALWAGGLFVIVAMLNENYGNNLWYLWKDPPRNIGAMFGGALCLSGLLVAAYDIADAPTAARRANVDTTNKELTIGPVLFPDPDRGATVVGLSVTGIF